MDAVAYIHERGIIHRDLKLANVLIDEEDDLRSIKIIDFGFGNCQKLSNASYDDHVGTLKYMAPEVAGKAEYTKSVDIWAIGIIMHIILSGGVHPLYDKETDNAETFAIKLANVKKIDAGPSLSWLAKNLFSRLTMIQAHQRYTAKDAMRHPWITRKQQSKIP